MNHELITFIVPIYNVERYLKECLDSIQQQTYPYFECIMVNDGSTDSSASIAEEYLFDNRFRLIHQQNQGLSAARNTGIQHVSESSSFVSFVDSDDFIHPTFLEKLIIHIEEDVDLIEGSYEKFKDGDKPQFYLQPTNKIEIISKKEIISKTTSAELRVSAFPRLIRKSILSDQFFPIGWTFEDLAVFPELVLFSRKWIKTQDIIYAYRIRENSITNSSFTESRLDIFKILDKFDNLFKNEDFETKVLVERLKFQHLFWHEKLYLPEGSRFKLLYENELESIQKNIREYEKQYLYSDLISIIVPIYNGEQYLPYCLESILKQKYHNFEVILVNDGSIDSSEAICRQYVNRDDRFRYVQKEHGGASSARNYGLELVKGEYVTFIDADDWVEENYLELLHQSLKENNADISVSTYKKFDVDTNLFYLHAFQINESNQVFTQKELVEKLPQLERITESFEIIGGKLVKKSLLLGIQFNERTQLSENMEFWFKLYLLSNRIAFVNKEIYNFRLQDSEARKLYNAKNYVDDIRVRMDRIPLLVAKGYDTKPYLENLKNYLNGRIQYLEQNDEGQTTIARWIKEQYYLLTNQNH